MDSAGWHAQRRARKDAHYFSEVQRGPDGIYVPVEEIDPLPDESWLAQSQAGFRVPPPTSGTLTPRMTEPASDDTPSDFTSQISGTLNLETSCDAGAFGVVHRRTIQSSKGTMEVAVKVFKIDAGKEMERINKGIHRETKVWLRLKHATIVPLLGTANVDSPFPALVSQWMPFGTLYVYLEKATTLTVSVRDGLAKGVAEGLKYRSLIPIISLF
ncbi:uncharacterized protein EDB91DRAFT_153907 [Suillus paluster]|uniref:uncharacterized protein n=1 Tax=Suillus paluster TaxID=48578 RepID=UPI001B85FC3B|nr:uncharacterized protein EDB91DRAFT_153907 [Suillus paluster]KAG1745547.1 hypothetical protein EDB91DRAFT_153907 [Suillus paluster]